MYTMFYHVLGYTWVMMGAMVRVIVGVGFRNLCMY